MNQNKLNQTISVNSVLMSKSADTTSQIDESNNNIQSNVLAKYYAKESSDMNEKNGVRSRC